MSSTMAFGLVLQTLSLLDVTHKSTQDEVFTLVAIATAEFAFVCSVVSIVIKRRINRKKNWQFVCFQCPLGWKIGRASCRERV